MRKSFWGLALLSTFVCVVPTKAQDEAPRLEAFGGYYYARFNINANVPGIAHSATYNGNGGVASWRTRLHPLARGGGRSGRLSGDQ